MAIILPFLRQPHRYPALKPPTAPIALNQDSWQSQGLQVWVPGINGDTEDYSLFNRSVSVTGTVPFVVIPEIDVGGLDFDSTTNSNIDYGSLPFLAKFTLFYWGFPKNGTTNEYYASAMSRGGVFVNNTNFDFGLRRHDAGIVDYREYLYARNGSTLKGTEVAAGSGALPDTVQQFAATWESGAQVIYRNAVSVKTSSATNGADGSQTFKIGEPSAKVSTSTPFDGYLTDARVYDFVMSAEQVLEVYSPETRWDLYYELGRVFYSIPAAAAASDPFFAHRIDRISKGQGPVDAAMLGGVMIE